MSNESIGKQDFSVIPTPDGDKLAHELCGWLGPRPPEELAKMAPFTLKSSAPVPPKGSRSMLYELGRKVLNQDPPNYAQEIGCCTGFGGKNCIENVQFYQIASGAQDTFHLIFPSYLYGISRKQIGGGQGYRSDGSTGAWIAQGVMKYGVIPSDAPGCPKYSGQVSRDWGYYGPPAQFIPIGQKHIVKTISQVHTLDDVRTALANFYPVNVCSDVGFDMTVRSDGFNWHSQTWNHSMAILGFDDGDEALGIPANYLILNSWGDVHGKIVDFRTKETWPVGTLRVSPANIQKMISQGDSFAYSAAVDGWPAQTLPRNFFDIF